MQLRGEVERLYKISKASWITIGSWVMRDPWNSSEPYMMWMLFENIQSGNKAFLYLLVITVMWHVDFLSPNAFLSLLCFSFINNFIYFFILAVLGLHCCIGFSLVAVSGDYSLVAISAQAPPHCSGFASCREVAGALACMGPIVVAPRL